MNFKTNFTFINVQIKKETKGEDLLGNYVCNRNKTWFILYLHIHVDLKGG